MWRNSEHQCPAYFCKQLVRDGYHTLSSRVGGEVKVGKQRGQQIFVSVGSHSVQRHILEQRWWGIEGEILPVIR